MSEARKEPAFGRAGDDSGQIRSHLHFTEERKERLQDELADLLLQPSEEDIDSGRLDALLAELDEIDPVPEDEVLDTEESLKRFHKRYGPLFSTVEEPSAQASEAAPEKKHFHFAVFKFAAVAAALVFVLGTVAQAFGLNVWGAVARWNSDIFQFRSEEVPYATVRFDPLEEGETASYDTLEEAVDVFGITAPIMPTWLPERFAITSVDAQKRSGGISICADYESDDGYFQIRYNKTVDLDLNGLEKEADYMGVYACSKINHYLMSDMERWKAYWQNGELECRMSGSVSEQEMKDIIDSIYED